MVRILYISYDGMLEPLGQSQVLQYLERLAPDYKFFLISFEKLEDRANQPRMKAMRERLKNAGITWIPLPYHKSPSVLATAFDIATGFLVGLYVALSQRIDVVHARSYVPALMALFIKRLTNTKFLFDMRGFWADERVDGKIWKKDSYLYRITKFLERRLLLISDHVVTLTNSSVPVLETLGYLRDRMPAITVIPTCTNLELFHPPLYRTNDFFIFGYVGSVGTWYLFDETLDFFKELTKRRPDARLLVVNRREHQQIRNAVIRAGIDLSRLELIASEHNDVPALIGRMHAAAALVRPDFSKIASAPTKVAEYLGCGVPCVSNIGVGDMHLILEENKVGVCLSDFSKAAMIKAVDQLLTLVADSRTSNHCRETAERLFSLDLGVARYRELYLHHLLS